MYKDEVVSHRYKRKVVVVIRQTIKDDYIECKKSYIARKEHTTISAGRVMRVMSNREIKTKSKRRVGMIEANRVRRITQLSWRERGDRP